MRKLIVFFTVFGFYISYSQETGSIAGILTDKEANDEPLAFANVLIKGTTKGTTSDFDGLYEISGLEPGNYTVVFSYLGYETLELPNITVEAGKVTTVNVPMSASEGVSLDEVTVVTVARKDSEVALLLDQKNAVTVVESIGAKELGDLGISDAKTATTKISGVSESEASGDIFVRGLGDRYLSTTLNGLPIPSDNVDKKNINLGLFPTRVIQNVSISKTYSARTSADQASGNINITSRELIGSSELSIGISGGVNSSINEDGAKDNFKISPNLADETTFGFYDANSNLVQQLTEQSWDPSIKSNPYNYGVNLTLGKKFFDGKLSFVLTGAHDESYRYNEGIYQILEYGFVQVGASDYTTFQSEINNTALLDLTWFINDKNKLKSTTTYLSTLNDDVVEFGRNGEAQVSDDTGAFSSFGIPLEFVRDQNTKQTNLLVSQLLGEHKLSEKNQLNWAFGYNLLNADEPNRIRNQVFFDTTPESSVALNSQGGFNQRKAAQLIEDNEYNGYINDVLHIIKEEDTNKAFDIELGVFYRNKERDFSSEFVGVVESSDVDRFSTRSSSLDDLNSIISTQNFGNGSIEVRRLSLNENGVPQDIYTGEFTSQAAYVDFNVALNKLNVNAGLRAQKDDINVIYDVGGSGTRLVGETNQKYQNFYPSLNLKYTLNDKHALRFAASRTITLPEFKEIAPFRYVAPSGQEVTGNADNLTASFTNNFDIKWEFFPSNDQLISLAVFYKDIKDPINRTVQRGGESIWTFENTGEKAEVLGLELESKLNLLKPYYDEPNDVYSGIDLSLVLNATVMHHEQDLKFVPTEDGLSATDFFKFGTNNSTGLEGASDFILNTNLNLKTSSENPFTASLNANYASDKIYVLGSPEGFDIYDYSYNDNIVEKGFVVLNGRISKEFAEKWQVSLNGQNLLNPEIKRTQGVLENRNEIRAFSDDINERLGPNAPERIVRTETVRSYKLGRTIGIGLTYSF
ncbi:TonB-dependent receptor [Maribacter cobaltidurans]|uniref:TonB-dependent receptor n=1 Tax=Maribacter cobaltidurans TaxID=1178778 RepID=A0A223V5F2_9FLAO|nr:TonB-dependent receptor [Maribacter cobaltidurans]ASV30532.1 TonB-dependent receptor [Maribacter cobaltidurans]GGD79504.1 collagen-binding protein [Maribacter cobaltidurans]